ncbi:septum formation initiator family protein [Nocardioides sp. TF02-7]|uniref:septum formation initiator family protein n=1 Tax=Nocardioides sp. TF02-7 TaxID=2917724 RepID=UPI001F063F9C|nr:septum formation initiator family protein [Nocardioides sp. TF02-7]UMG92101.1 septum formation initiator family protein [Nocardioides sp. TF02-7]
MSSTAPQLRSRIPRFAGAAVERARLTVVPRPRTRPRAPRVPFVILVSVLLLGGVVGLLLFNTSMQQAAFRTTALERQAGDLSARQEALQLELQELRDGDRLARVAQRELGMVIPAGGVGVLELGSGQVAGDPEPAQAGQQVPVDLPGQRRPPALDPGPVQVVDRDGVPDRDRDRARSRLGR